MNIWFGCSPETIKTANSAVPSGNATLVFSTLNRVVEVRMHLRTVLVVACLSWALLVEAKQPQRQDSRQRQQERQSGSAAENKVRVERGCTLEWPIQVANCARYEKAVGAPAGICCKEECKTRCKFQPDSRLALCYLAYCQ